MNDFEQAGPAGTASHTTDDSTAQTARDAAQTAKEEAGDVAATAKDAGGRVVEQAQSAASDVAHEAQDQLRAMWDRTRDEMSSQAGDQQHRLAGGMQTFSADLHAMAGSAEGGLAAEVVRRVAERSGRAGDWLASRGPEELLDDVRSFARRRPATFLLVAAGAGVLVGRLSRALKDASSAESGDRRPVHPTEPRHAASTDPFGTPPAPTTVPTPWAPVVDEVL
jgi:hypothetical protein